MSRRGICLLINNVKNLTGEENFLTKVFSSLGFNVVVKRDLSMIEIIGVAQKFAGKDHSSYDSFVFIVLSKCRPGELIAGVDGREVILEQVMSEFRPFNSTSLKNKPKLFFVLRFVNSKTQSAEHCSGGTEFFKQGVFPKEADFLLACSTSPIVEGEKIKHPQPSFSEVRLFHRIVDLTRGYVIDLHFILRQLNDVTQLCFKERKKPSRIIKQFCL